MVRAYNDIPPLTAGVADALAAGSNNRIASADVVKNAVTKGFTPVQTVEFYAQKQLELEEQQRQIFGRLNAMQPPQVDTSGIRSAQDSFNQVMANQPQAPTQTMPQLEDWQKIAVAVAALFGGQNAGAVFQGIQQGTLGRNQLENEQAQQNFANQQGVWENTLRAAQTNLGAAGDIAGIEARNAQNVFEGERDNLRIQLEGLLKQYDVNADTVNAIMRDMTTNRRIDQQQAVAIARTATVEMNGLLRTLKDAPPESRRAIYQQIRSIAPQGSTFATMTDEDIELVASATTATDKKMEVDQARIDRMVKQNKLTDAQAAKIIEETKWIPKEYQSRIETRKSQIELGRGRLNVSLESLKERISRNQFKEAKAERNAIEKDLKAQLSLLNEEESIYKAILSQTEDVNSPEFIQASASMQRVNRDRKALVKSLQELRGMKIEEPQATQGASPSSVMGGVAGDIANTVGGMVGSGALNDPRANQMQGPKVQGVPPGGLPAPQGGSKPPATPPKKTTNQPLKTSEGYSYKIKK